ncbi:MAG: hypothetical protein SGI97_06805 [candidate division Zixibacteria bacterium]|nr:hypothetical protein [candidate division Zixibacteria bacterium]
MSTTKHFKRIIQLMSSMALAFAASFTVISCQTDSDDTIAEVRRKAVEEQRENSQEANEDYLDAQRKEYSVMINNRIDSLETNIEALKDRVDNQGGSTLNAEVERLEFQKTSLEDALDRMSDVTESNWETFKRDMDQMFRDNNWNSRG